MGATGDKLKGKAMKAEGRLTGDPVRRAEGAIVEAKGDVEGAVGRAARKVKRGARKLARKVRRRTGR